MMIKRSPEVQKVIDNLSVSLCGKIQIEAEAAKICPTCGEPLGEFRNQSSMNEFKISGMCQGCQDSVFGPD